MGEEVKQGSWLKSPYFWAAIGALIFIPLMRPLLRREPPPPPPLFQLPAFELVDSLGEPFGSADLEGQVWVANFVFTRCASICPLLTRSMAQLQQRYADEGVDVRLVSVSVDPEYDTPERLREYGELHQVDSSRWSLLTGPEEQVRALVAGGFKTAMGVPVEQAGGLIDIAHFGKFALVDGSGQVRGFYGTDEDGLDEIFHRSRHVLKQERD